MLAGLETDRIRSGLTVLFGEVIPEYCEEMWKDENCGVAALAAQYFIECLRQQALFDKRFWTDLNRTILLRAQQKGDPFLVQDALYILEEYTERRAKSGFTADEIFMDIDQLSFKSL